jgi:mono/diheme cytochrome c family protein
VRWSLPVWLLIASLAAADQPVDYARDVKHLLQERCFACHGALKQQGKLRLDSGGLIRKGGKSGPIVVPGKAVESRLIERVSDPDEGTRMPPEGQPLTAVQIAAIKAWIDQGAKSPADDAPEPDPRDHWAFRAPVRPPVPAGGKNPIDAFLAAEWRKRGLKPQSFADKRLLLRRVHLDLTGLPPSPEQVDAFLKDTSSNAYEKVVNQLLESPQYGERWARHFMDVWRYSDWWGLGAEVRNSQKHMWHWRDWIVESLNADKGYNRMVREMLAADELYPTDLDALRATGYLARQYFIFNRTTWMDETVEHTAKAFLGLTLNCTKCHDHKYDPIRQDDYYRFRAFFEPYQVRAEMLPGEADFEKDALPRAFDCNADAPTYKHRRGDDRQPIKEVKITPGLPAVLSGELKVEPVNLPAEAHAPHLRAFVEANYLRMAEAKVAATREAVVKAKAALAAAERDAKREPGAATPETKGIAAAPGKLLARDDFAKPNPDLWDVGPGKWKHEKGALVQSFPDAERSVLRLKATVPTDFEAKFKYTVTGGEPWRSVGISFDVAGDNEVMVYTSAMAGGPKLQVSYKQGGNYLFPADGMVARPFKAGDTVELVVRARGPVVNVVVNGEHALAYRLPVGRKPGAIELITFAATAEFRAFELSTLPAETKLVEPAGGPKAKANPEQARLALAAAEKALAAAEAEVPSLKARFAAERAKYAKAADASILAKAAATAEKQAALAAAEEALAKAELEVDQAASDKKAAAEKKRDAAKTTVATTKKAVDNPGEAYTAPRGALKTKEDNNEGDASRLKPFPATSTGRRSALANWITDRKNPLAARVAVNHVWNRHFGTPLVATVFDFGRKGAKPTHPELLDWLAVEFMESGWSLKHLHKLIVMSDFYRLSSSSAGADPTTVRADPENKSLWRRNPVRMESQVVRDSLLHLAGQLDLTRGGPSVDVTGQADSRRRSLYFVHSHNDHHKFLMQFDDAGVLECYRRTESIVPQQALTLSNSKFTLTMADAIAARLSARVGKSPDSDFVTAAFELILSGTPTAEERQASLEAMAEWQKVLKDQKHPDPTGRSRADLVGALLNHNDFVTVR